MLSKQICLGLAFSFLLSSCGPQKSEEVTETVRKVQPKMQVMNKDTIRKMVKRQSKKKVRRKGDEALHADSLLSAALVRDSLLRADSLYQDSLAQFSEHRNDTLRKMVNFRNNALPHQGDTLRILAIGNSYTEDATEYMGELVKAAGIDQKKLAVYTAIKYGSPLDYWSGVMLSDEVVALKHRAGTYPMKCTKGTLREILAQHWDVVVVQQVSTKSIDYSSFNPALSTMISGVYTYCTNPKVAMAWQMAWAYGAKFRGAPYGVERWARIRDAVKKQVELDGINIVIPAGTAVENARTSFLQTPHDITRDGLHMAYGVGRYIAACTWYQTLIAPVFNKSVLYLPFKYQMSDAERGTISHYKLYECQDVTDDNVMLMCQRCAAYAVWDKYNITEMNE